MNAARKLDVEFRPRPVADALTPELATPEAKLVWLLRAALAALAVYSLTVTPRFTTRPLLFLSAFFGLLFSLAFAFVPTTRPRTLKSIEAATLVAFMMHVMGHAFGFYASFWWYDKMLHFVVPIVLALIIYGLSQATDWIWNWRKITPLEVAIYLFSMVVTIGAFWEIVEFGMDQLFGTQEQNGNFDTMTDIIFDFLGGILGAVVAAWATAYGRKNGFSHVSEEPKRPYPMRAPHGGAKE